MTASAPLAICVSGGFLLGGVESGLPLQLTVGTVVVAVSLVHGAWLLRLAGGLFQQGDRQTGRSAAVFCGAVLLCGVTVAVVPLDRPVGLAGIVAAVLAVMGLLALPGAAPDRAAALRRGLDGLCVALWKFLTIWVLILEARGGLSPLAFGTCLLACIGLTVAVVSGVRAKFPRGATLITSAGTAAVVFALAVLQLLPSSGSARRDWLLGAAGLLILGPVLIWGGVRRAIISPGPGAPAPTITDGTLVGDPLLVAPVLAGIAAVGYDAVSRGGLSATTLALGLAAVLAVTVRESLEALRVRRFAGQLAVHEAHFRSLVAGSSDVIVVLDPDLSVRWQSPAAARQFGLSDQEVLGRPFTALIHTEDHERVYVACAEPGGITAARLCDGFGVWRPTEFTVSDLRESPEVRGLVVHLRDVSERLELEETLRHTARTDSLTGLVNRATFLHEIAAREATGIVLAIGLDGFAAVNDVHGPDVGDALLVEVARRIRTTVEPGDLAARLSGDEFAVRTQVSKVRAYTLANRLLSELTEPFRLPGVELRLSAGVGLADGGSEDALRRAGLALRWAKRSGRGSVEWHDATVEQAAVRRGHIEQELPLAVRGGQLDLAYQPVYDLVEGRPVGVEALLRWRHPDLGTVPPLETVAAAAELGLAAELHTWVLNRACRQLAAWRREGYRLWLSVNVGVDDLLATDFAAGLSLALDSHQVDAADLVIEVSEREFGPSLDDAVTALTTVREIGVRTALDGFGAGSTYLAHLRHLPADILKVDRSLFTDPPMQGGRATPIIEAVVGLGNKLGLTVVAHGLEAEDHLELVRRAGCRFGQGFLYGQPGPAERIEAELVHATL